MSLVSSPVYTAAHDMVGTGGGPPILVVLVLYKKEASRSISLVSFLRALDETGLASQFRLLVYDNSPIHSVLPDGIPIPISSIHDPANGGLFRAYTAALELAEKDGNEWMLLLDQDTVLDAAYLNTLRRKLPQAAGNPTCAAMVPKLLSGNVIISPARISWSGRMLPVDKKFTGIPTWEITGLNSGTLLRVSAIRAIGGFNPMFWLDYLDHWIFNQLYRAGYSTYVLDVALEHELSVKSMKSMSVSRYCNILSAEAEFYACCRSRAENIAYHFRLIFRSVKMFVSRDTRKLLLPALAKLLKSSPGKGKGLTDLTQ